MKNKFSVETELWDFNNGDKRFIDPTLTSNDYGYGMGIYLVPSGFCTV